MTEFEVHSIPVPHGWSVEQSWEAISRGELLSYPASWANVVVRDGKFVELVTDRQADR